MKDGISKRIELLDFLRGISIIYVMIYHLFFDLTGVKAISFSLDDLPLSELTHDFFVGQLIVISGICTGFSRDPVRRGAILFFMGEALTIATDLFYREMLIVFGALSFFGVMMMLCGLAKTLLWKIDWRILLAASILLYVITLDFSSEDGLLHLFFTDIRVNLPENVQYSYPIGILSKGFYSMDYFPLIPNGFLYLAGAALSLPVREKKLPKAFYADTKPKLINFLGRNSLIFYIIHQPIFIGILFLKGIIWKT